MIIHVKVIPKSSRNQIIGYAGDVLKIKCTAAPEKGKANASVIELLSKYYHVPKSAITILKGKTSAKKIIEINQRSNQKHNKDQEKK